MKMIMFICLFITLCYAPCWGMEFNMQEKPSVFQAIEACAEILQSQVSDDEKSVALEEVKTKLIKADLDERFDGWTPLLYLLHNFGSNETLVRVATEVLLIDEDKEKLERRVNATAPVLSRRPLHYAAGYGYFWLVDQLVQAQADIKKVDVHRADALHYVCGCDTSLVPDQCKEALNSIQQISVSCPDGSFYKVNIPEKSFEAMRAFCLATRVSPWQAYEPSKHAVEEKLQRYALNLAYRAQIIHFLVNNMLFHFACDERNKVPESYAKASGYFLLEYVLNNRHSELSMTEKFFHHGLRAWCTIFGIIDEIVRE